MRNERSNSNVSGNVFAGLRKANTKIDKKKSSSEAQAWDDTDLNDMFNKR